ncbi:hemin uptake protein HemP [Breoghania sp. L-A4]
MRTPPEPMTISSETLFQGAREIRITHDGTLYRMTITRLNKLILTK